MYYITGHKHDLKLSLLFIRSKLKLRIIAPLVKNTDAIHTKINQELTRLSNHNNLP